MSEASDFMENHKYIFIKGVIPMLDFKKYIKEVTNIYNEQEVLDAQQKLLQIKEEEKDLLKKKKLYENIVNSRKKQ